MKFFVGTMRAIAATLVLATLAGCIVVPAHRHRGYGHRAQVEVDVYAPPVVVGPGRPGHWHRRPR